MKQLETQVKKGAFTYEIIERTEFHAIQVQKCRQSGIILAYEVFRINKNKEFTLGGNVIPASEARPGNEQFGTSAWCFSTFGGRDGSALDLAKAKFAELEQSIIQKQNQQHEGEIQSAT